MKIILLSGPIASGKSTLVGGLAKRFDALGIKTNVLLKKNSRNTDLSRGELQKLGDRLDRNTKGAWVRKELDEIRRKFPKKMLVVDAVRKKVQIEHIQKAYGRDVVHVHLKANDIELEKRYKKRAKSSTLEFSNYSETKKNRTEQQISNLSDIADIVIDTGMCDEGDVLVRVASQLGLFGRDCTRLVDVLVGGQYGSEGKGQIAAFLSHEYSYLIRVGGPNAGHKVKEDPGHYTFHSLPSGTRITPKANLIIGPGASLHVDTLMKEISTCQVSCDRLSIHPQAVIITDDDKESEKKLVKEIGSTGQGVGVAAANRILMRGSVSKIKFAKDIDNLRPYVRDTLEILDEAFRNNKRVLLEGTQGTGLSIFHGSYPHVTSRDTTVAGCLSEAGISPSRVRKILMVTRTYPIRVESPKAKGKTSGPMKREITFKELHERSGIPYNELISTERTSTTKKQRRIAEFDWELLRKSTSLNAPTDIALTFIDYISVKNRNAKRFEQLTDESIRFIEEVERVSMAPVSLISTNFHQRSIIDRRNW